jgi:hypothetical protein
MTEKNLTNRQILLNAFINNTKVSFVFVSNFYNAETYVTIVKLQNDDVSNLKFSYKTKKGDIFTSFENNILFM